MRGKVTKGYRERKRERKCATKNFMRKMLYINHYLHAYHISGIKVLCLVHMFILKKKPFWLFGHLFKFEVLYYFLSFDFFFAEKFRFFLFDIIHKYWYLTTLNIVQFREKRIFNIVGMAIFNIYR